MGWMFLGRDIRPDIRPDVRGISCPKTLCLSCFSVPEHIHFSGGPCGTIVPRTNPYPSQGQTGQNGDFAVEFNRKRPVCPKDGPRHRDGSRLFQVRFLFVPNTVPPIMFMFVGFLEGPTRKPRHASVLSTHSDTQAVPALHCIRMFKGIFSTRAFLKRTDTLSTIA